MSDKSFTAPKASWNSGSHENFFFGLWTGLVELNAQDVNTASPSASTAPLDENEQEAG